MNRRKFVSGLLATTAAPVLPIPEMRDHLIILNGPHSEHILANTRRMLKEGIVTKITLSFDLDVGYSIRLEF